MYITTAMGKNSDLLVYFLLALPFPVLAICTLSFQKDYESMEEVCQLRTLVSNLRELITLHRKYNCRLALSDFEKVKVWIYQHYFLS